MWVWVGWDSSEELQEAKEKDTADAESKRLGEAAEAAAREVTMQADEQKAIETSFKAFRLQLRAHAQRFEKTAKDNIAAAEELWVLREDKRHTSMEAETDTACLLLDHSPMQDTAWMAGIPSGKPMVVLFDFALEPPAASDIVTALNIVGTSGLVVAIMSGTPVELGSMTSLEAEALKKVNFKSPVTAARCFLHFADQAHVGWALLLCGQPSMSSAAAAEDSLLLQRVFTSSAVAKTGSIMNLPSLNPDERICGRDRHALLPHQRGQRFYSRILTDLCVLPQLELCAGVTDFVMVEVEAGVGDLMSLFLTMRTTHVSKESADADEEGKNPVTWVGSVRKLPAVDRTPLLRRSRVQERLSSAHQKLNLEKAQRKLKRHRTDTDERLEVLSQHLPKPPSLPYFLQERVVKVSTWSAGGCMRISQDGLVDASLTKPGLPKEADMAKFTHHGPAPLALAKACLEAHVIVGPSAFIAGESGLYPTEAFAEDDVILFGVSFAGRWLTEAESTTADARYTIEILLASPFKTSKPAMRLVGDPSRHPWAVMNSSLDSGRPANVKACVVGGEMGDSFLVFKAVRGIEAFGEELLWEYQNTDTGAKNVLEPRVTAVAAAADASPAVAAAAGASASAAVAAAAGASAAVGAAAVGAAAEASEPEEDEELPASDAVSVEELESCGQKLTAFVKPEGWLYFLPDQASIYAAFETGQSKLTPRVLFTATGGSTRTGQEWAAVPYELEKKSKVWFEGECKKLSEAMAKASVKLVWGYKEDMKASCNDMNGAPVKLHWMPKAEMSALCGALLKVQHVKPIFSMSAKEVSGEKMLTPSGIVFFLEKSVSFSPGTVVRLPTAA